MRYKTAILSTVVFVASMFLFELAVMTTAGWFVRHAVEIPRFFRVLLGIAAFWKNFWWLTTLLVLVILVAFASLTAALRQSKSRIGPPS